MQRRIAAKCSSLPAQRGELGHAGLEGAAGLEQLERLVDAELGAGVHQALGDPHRAHADAAGAAGAHLHDAGLGERGDGQPHGRPADLHERGQAPLAGQVVALAELAGADAVDDLAEHVLERLARPHGREQLLGRHPRIAISAIVAVSS